MTRVVYRYRDPWSLREFAVKAHMVGHEPEQAFNLMHPDVAVFKSWSDPTERDGTKPKERRIIDHYLDPKVPNQLIIIVTDP
jgi:hypothetical protein